MKVIKKGVEVDWEDWHYRGAVDFKRLRRYYRLSIRDWGVVADDEFLLQIIEEFFKCQLK